MKKRRFRYCTFRLDFDEAFIGFRRRVSCGSYELQSAGSETQPRYYRLINYVDVWICILPCVTFHLSYALYRENMTLT